MKFRLNTRDEGGQRGCPAGCGDLICGHTQEATGHGSGQSAAADPFEQEGKLDDLKRIFQPGRFCEISFPAV